MEYSADRVLQLATSVSWLDNQVIRIFWISTSKPRREFASEIERVCGDEAYVPLVVRGTEFTVANALLSDVHSIFSENEAAFTKIKSPSLRRITVFLISKDDFRFPQGASPIELPNWFPLMAGRETYFHISDLALTAREKMLDCAEARIDHVSELVYELEESIVALLERHNEASASQVTLFINAAHGNTVPDKEAALREYRTHIGSVVDSRKYRPNAAADAKSLISRFLKLVLNNSPKNIAASAKIFGSCFSNSTSAKLNPTLFAAMFRPAAKMDDETSNWHAILMGFYQAYQLMNGAAHAGEYPAFPVALQYSSSLNLRTFLVEAREYTDSLS